MKRRVAPLKFGHWQSRVAVEGGKWHDMQDQNVVVHKCDWSVARREASKPGCPEFSRPISNPRSKRKQFAQLVHVRFVFAACGSYPEPVAVLADDPVWWIIAPG